MIPTLIDIGAPWSVLPSGTHEATLDDIQAVFGIGAHRAALERGFRRGCNALQIAGCAQVYLNGSFVTGKPLPDDFDACWDPGGVDLAKLDPVLKDFSNARRNQKMKYGGEFFPAPALADGTRTFVEFFQVEKNTGQAKGLVLVRL